MMLPVARFKSQPVGMVTTTPWLSVSSDPPPQWVWFASWSAAAAAAYQATPPLVFYPPAVWIPEHSNLIQWERPAVEVIPLIPPLYRSSPLHPHHPFPKLAEGWTSPEEVGIFMREKPLLLSNQMLRRPGGHAPRSRLLLSPSRVSVPVLRDTVKARDVDPEDSSSSPPSPSCSSVLPLHLLSVSPLRLPIQAAPPAGGAYWEWAGLPTQRLEKAWPLILPRQRRRGVWLRPSVRRDKTLSPPTQECLFGPVFPYLTKDRCPVLPVQVMKKVPPSFFSSRFSSRFTLLTDCRHKKQLMGGAKVSYGGALLLRAERTPNTQDVHREEEDEEDEEETGEKTENKRPVASTPVPGSPWCVVWTGDDRVFFFNPTIHLSVWEKPGELIGRDISRIIEDPPHKRKKLTPDESSSSCQSSGFHGEENDDGDNDHKHKRNRTEESLSLVPHPGEVKLLPLELRRSHYRQMLLERGVSAFSTWEKELHKMVFDPRYLLLTSEQRKQEFEQFVKSRMKEEYKEKRTKLQKAREDFKLLLEESKITSRWTFKEFCVRFHGDQRFSALNRRKEQEMLFSQHLTSLKRRDKENRARLRKMR
ncbi:uncharacterized protein LOC115393665 [Salarias fasciatus]|uniref:uncharacterized protein LOC115393665 n=1 Tax=Salarias fasciatus TaxID=181472 RepID=UPI001176B9B4|nr:uncharacterized protein LOC115393665 [Salarias fasciatus]XP_029954631.1 uncharacterized protein LOC115393665 [Salarias fasciatus]